MMLICRLHYKELIIKVDCEWDEWIIGECSKTCGGGMRNNYRDKKVEEMFGGVCDGFASVSGPPRRPMTTSFFMGDYFFFGLPGWLWVQSDDKCFL